MVADRARRPSREDAIIDLPAVELRDRMASGALRVTDLARAFLARIEAREADVRAWIWHDPGFVLEQAAALDAWRTSGRPVGPLHGLPVGVKDIIDTAKIPTGNGTAIDDGRIPTKDATVVKRLRAAGALIMGKTVTTELAYFAPGKTRNPHNTEHTPGGSSSGSAAAVAAGMVPLAIGTQTAGSVIRPASYCGVVGFKPSFGSIARDGVLAEAPSLDTIGVFARSPDDAALVAEVLFGQSDDDPATSIAPPPALLATSRSRVPVPPDIAFVATPWWGEASPGMQDGLLELVEVLGERCRPVELPAGFAEARAGHRKIQLAEMARAYRGYEARGRDRLHAKTVAAIDEGRQVLATEYIEALEARSIYNLVVDELFERFDAILTPAAPGAAPAGLDATGDPVFNSFWTMCGLPAVTLPLLADEAGMPMGVQLVGARGNDGRLLRTANWLIGFARAATQGEDVR